MHASRSLMLIYLFRRVFFVSCALLANLAQAAAAVDATELARQREQFPLVWETAKRATDDTWLRLAPGLESYPLFPYLQLAALQRRIGQVRRAEVDKFLTAWPGTLPAQILRDAFLLELAKRNEWKDFLALVPDSPRSKELQCDALQARLALGQTPDFKRDVEPLWLSPVALPSACDTAVRWAREHGKLTPELVWKRIDVAARAGTGGLVSTLAVLLDGTERSAAERMAMAVSDPAKALNDAGAWTDTPRTREAMALAFERLARRNSELAETQWAKLESRFHFDAGQRGRVLRALAIYRATSYAPDALARLEALPADLTDDTTREWRVRMALASQDFGKTLAGLEAMPAAQQADPRWRYLHARMLIKREREADAMPLLSTLAQEANFHGFLAADWLQQPYTICPSELTVDAAQEASLRPQLGRAFEFFALDRLTEARREWDFVMPALNAAQKRAAADLASDIGWYDRAVYTLNTGDDLHLYTLRFPLARRDQITRAAHSAGIDPAWAYAIIRAESAWTSDAHSGADAWGLMQLLPGTAAQLAKANKVRYGGARDLLDADTNITLGTRYLSDMAQHYDGSPWLASAAYNAGVEPVGRWIDARDALEPDFFIETIPYKETREYVSRVLAFTVIYDWRMHGSASPLSAKLPRIGSAYTTPADDAPRKSVVCAAQPAPTRQSAAEPVPTPDPATASAQHR